MSRLRCDLNCRRVHCRSDMDGELLNGRILVHVADGDLESMLAPQQGHHFCRQELMTAQVGEEIVGAGNRCQLQQLFPHPRDLLLNLITGLDDGAT